MGLGAILLRLCTGTRFVLGLGGYRFISVWRECRFVDTAIGVGVSVYVGLLFVWI